MTTLLYAYLLAVYALFLLYVLTMGFQRAWPRMSLFERTLAAPVIVTGVAWDWFVNMTLASAVFMDRPGSMGELVTARLKRYKYGVAYVGSRRRAAAIVICKSLDKFDPSGDHC